MKMAIKSFVIAKRIKLICASILMVGASVAFAEPAFIITDGSCGMADGDGNFFSSTDVKQIVTNSSNGNINLKCRAKGVPNTAGVEVIYNASNTGAVCTALDIALTTEVWEEVVDEKGNAVLSCKFRLY